MLAGIGRLPEGKVRRVALVSLYFLARARRHGAVVAVGQGSVTAWFSFCIKQSAGGMGVIRRHVEVDVSLRSNVAEASLHDGRHEVQDVRDALRDVGAVRSHGNP